MEELRSTEILDKEIQADARKKAERILERAEAEAKKLLAAIDARLEKSEKELEAKTKEECSEFQKDKEASFPLEKARFFVSYVEESMEKCVGAYFESLSQDERLDLLLRLFQKYQDALTSKSAAVYVYGFRADDVKKRLDGVLQVSRYEQTEFNKFIVEDDFGAVKKEGIIIESDDKTVRVRMTIPELARSALNARRTELYSALFGGRLEDK
ncbi:MAG: hypothetical protein ACTTKL_08760 [Treponema sp.]